VRVGITLKHAEKTMREKGRWRLELMRFVIIVRGEKHTVPVDAGVV
jgi:hypothetical protein